MQTGDRPASQSMKIITTIPKSQDPNVVVFGIIIVVVIVVIIIIIIILIIIIIIIISSIRQVVFILFLIQGIVQRKLKSGRNKKIIQNNIGLQKI